MMNFDLPPIDSNQAPLFTTKTACNNWLTTLSLDNPITARTELHAQVKRLCRFPLDARERLAILDALWNATKTIQDHGAQKFAARPVPLDPVAQTAFDATDTLWKELALCHLRAVADSQDNKPVLAVALQRTAEIMLRHQYDCTRGRQALPSMHWQQLHQLLVLAEQHGLVSVEVKDPVRYGDTVVTPLSPYAAAMLLQAAGPYSLRLLQLGWTDRWARRWGSKLSLLTAPPADLKAVPLCLDLNSDQPATYRPAAGAGARFLETAELRKSILSRLALLEQNTPPEELQLGKDCTQPECGIHLKRLFQAWCQGGVPRRLERKPGSPGGKLIAGPEPIFDELSGGMSLLPQAELSTTDLRKQREAMAMFGSTRGLRINVPTRAPNEHIEQGWIVFDESMTGFRLERPLAQAGARLSPGQLLAVQPAGIKAFILATACWVIAGQDSKLQVGVSLMPMPASAIAIKPAGLTAAKEKSQPGFLLPPLAPTKEPASIVLPSGRFRAGRVVEFEDGVNSYQVRLVKLLDRGEDYDRASYEEVAAG